MDLKQYGEAEILVIKAFEKNEFEKNGVRETCRKLSDKYGRGADHYKNVYGQMKKYGAFELAFPDRFKDVYVSFATRLKTSNIERLEDLRKATSKSKQDIVNGLIESEHSKLK